MPFFDSTGRFNNLRSQVIFLYYHGYFMNLQSEDKRDRTLLMRSTRHLQQLQHLNFNMPTPRPPARKPGAFELLKIGSFKFPAPQVKMVFKCPNPIDGFVCELLPSFAVRGDINSRRKTILDAGYAVRCTRKDIN